MRGIKRTLASIKQWYVNALSLPERLAKKEPQLVWKHLIVPPLKLVLFAVRKIVNLIVAIYRLLKAIVLGVRNFFVGIYIAAKHNPKSFRKGLSSFFLIGLGQFRNKQWYKGAPLLVVFVIFLLVEFLTSDYIYAPGEIASMPAEDTLYFFRDYGGLFTRGLWGFFTLGALTAGATYRGRQIVTEDFAYDWLAADNSRTLMGEGVVILVLVLLLLGLWIYSVRDAYVTDMKIRAGMKVESFKVWMRRVWDRYFAYFIIIPAVALILLFIVVPFAFSFMVAFTNYDSAISLRSDLVEWHGLVTFREVFGAEPAYRDFFIKVFRWTAFYAVVSSLTVYILGFIQALIIESKYVFFKKVWRLILILPWAIPGMVSLLVFSNVFGPTDGLANRLLIEAGLLEQVRSALEWLGLIGREGGTGNIQWFTHRDNANLARFVIIMVNLWLGFPYFMLLITGVLGTIPNELYEAADIDGGSSTQKFRFITFPWVLRATAPVIITTFTFNFNNFGAIYFLTGGGPAYRTADVPHALRGIAPGQTDILISWIYSMAFESGDHDAYNLAAVYSILVFILIGVISIYYLSKLKSFWEED